LVTQHESCAGLIFDVGTVGDEVEILGDCSGIGGRLAGYRNRLRGTVGVDDVEIVCSMRRTDERRAAVSFTTATAPVPYASSGLRNHFRRSRLAFLSDAENTTCMISSSGSVEWRARHD